MKIQGSKSRALTTAEAVAAYMLSLPNALGVYLFGSVARDGDGRDIDMIVTVPNEVFARYIERFKLPRDGDFYFEFGGTRLARAGVELEFDEELLRLLDGIKIDLFLFPANWKQRLEELQTMFPHRDPRFMTNISVNAQQFEPDAGQFGMSDIVQAISGRNRRRLLESPIPNPFPST